LCSLVLLAAVMFANDPRLAESQVNCICNEVKALWADLPRVCMFFLMLQ
jgi:hypothetical protein